MKKSNGTTQIWADGYSFMEVTETLMTALGIRIDDQPAVTEPDQTDRVVSPSQDSPNGSPTCR
jgi:hypothetical protein